jgi:hypothetical protein
MKYQVVYYKQKKNKNSRQTATFYTIEDAIFWEKTVQQQGCIDIEVVPLFSK